MSKTNIEPLKNLYAKISGKGADTIDPRTIREAIDEVSAAYTKPSESPKVWDAEKRASGENTRINVIFEGFGQMAIMHGQIMHDSALNALTSASFTFDRTIQFIRQTPMFLGTAINSTPNKFIRVSTSFDTSSNLSKLYFSTVDGSAFGENSNILFTVPVMLKTIPV